MVNRRDSTPKSVTRLGPPGKTLETREQQLIAAAVDRAEQQLLDGTASAQVITHYLKLGSTRELLEQQRLKYENMLTQAKIEGLQSQKEIERLYGEALNAMSSYKGHDPAENHDD